MTCWAKFLLAVAVAGAVALPGTAQQPTKVFRLGILSPAARPDTKIFDACREGLRDLGYIDGQNTTIEYRLAAGDISRLPAMAGELVRLPVDVIVTDSQKAAMVAHEATRTIPIVGVGVGPDPVAAGLVGSFAHPGGNVTGLSSQQEDTIAKELELLKTAVPGAERIAVLVDPGNPTHAGVLRTVQQAAQASGTQLFSVEANAPGEVDGAFSAIVGEHADALVVLGGPLVMNQRRRIVDLAASNKLPAIYYERALVVAGGLSGWWSNKLRRRP